MPAPAKRAARSTRRTKPVAAAEAAPPLPDFDFPSRPDPAVRKVWRLRALAFASFYSIPVAFVLGMPLRLAMGSRQESDVVGTLLVTYVLAWLFMAIGGMVYVQAAYPRYRIEVRDEEVVVHKGVFFRTTSRIPLRKVQDIHVRQGPLLRAFGLASVKIDTAGNFTPARSGGGLMAEGQMPGIRNAHEVAEALMARVKALRTDL